MKAYTADEVGMEISTFDIPDQLAATGPKWGNVQGQAYDDVHLVGAVEGWIAGYATGTSNSTEPAVMVDDPEYPAKRVIHREPSGTIVMEARFGRNKKWVLAFNREDGDRARQWVVRWLYAENPDSPF